MFRRLAAVPAAVAVLAVLAFASGPTRALAGGHVDIRASALPATVEAGKAMPVTFSIAWPNGEPVTDAKPAVVAKLGRQRLQVPARATRRAGEYVAEFKLPSEGAWTFVVESNICGNTRTLSPVMAVAAGSGKGAKGATASR